MARPKLIPLLVTDGDIVSFGVLVPSVNDDGTVAVTAAHADGHTSLWRLWVGGRECIAHSADPRLGVARFTSHPDIDAAGVLSVYGARADGGTALFLADGDGVRSRVESGDRFRAIAPMGPTMNDRGDVAFRADLVDGGSGMYLSRPDGVQVVVETPDLASLDGLPVVDPEGDVVVRVADHSQVGSVLRVAQGRRTPVFTDGDELAQLGRFPMIASDGGVGVAAERRGRGWTYVIERGGVQRDVMPAGTYGFVRGGLLVRGGVLAVYVTPHGGAPTVLASPDGDVLFALGGSFLGATITDYALNPVSGTDAGWIAARISLSDGREVIARTVEPVGAWGC